MGAYRQLKEDIFNKCLIRERILQNHTLNDVSKTDPLSLRVI